MTDLVTILTSLVFIAFFVTTVVSILNGAPFVVTDKLTLATILKMSKIKKGSRVVDLGSGDGRIVMEFAKRGFETHGYEINLLLVFLSRIKIRRAGLTSIARIYGRSFWKINLAKYDLVVVYGINHIMSRLEKKLKQELKTGTKVITLAYKFPNWKIHKKAGSVYLYKKK